MRNNLLSKRQSHIAQFDRVYGAGELKELGLGQEVLFRFVVNDEYIPGTMVDKATAPHSYIIEAQGKCLPSDQGTPKVNPL